MWPTDFTIYGGPYLNDTEQEDVHADLHNFIHERLAAFEQELGLNPSGSAADVAARIAAAEAAGATIPKYVSLGAVTTNQVIDCEENPYGVFVKLTLGASLNLKLINVLEGMPINIESFKSSASSFALTFTDESDNPPASRGGVAASVHLATNVAPYDAAGVTVAFSGWGNDHTSGALILTRIDDVFT